MATLISEYVHRPSSNSRKTDEWKASREAGDWRTSLKEGEWKASLMEKLWIALMAIALAVATITAAADGSSVDNRGVSAPAHRVLVNPVAK